MLDTSVNVTPDELAATVEALYESVIRRIKWCVDPTSPEWEALEWEHALECVTGSVQAYTKTLMAMREVENVSPEFLEIMQFPDSMWDLINKVTLAESWDDVPTHWHRKPDRSCEICDLFALV